MDADLNDLGFDFEGDAWLASVRDAERPQALGRIGPYELLEEVSRGGQGVVFRAHQPGTGRDVALKRMLAGSFASSGMRRRFEREIEAAAALNHPCIVTAYGMEIVDGQPLFAMEWVDGVPITDWAAKESSPRAVLEVFARVCDAIEHAHERGVLHRDLKPSNILVSEDGRPHVLDFGLAKRIETEGGAPDLDLSRLTRSADFLGTPAYASPEQLAGHTASFDARGDVYSLGVILFEMLAGSSPYGEAETVTQLLRAVEAGNPPRPSSYEPELSREVDTIALKAMAREPGERYASVEALAEDVRRHLAGEPILALEPSSLYLMRKLILRNKLAVSFAATVLVLVVAFSSFSVWQWRLAAAERDDALEAKGLAFQQAQMAKEAALQLEQLLHRFADRGSPAGPGGELAGLGDLAPRRTLVGPAGPGDVPRATAPCMTGVLGSPNPWFDPDDRIDPTDLAADRAAFQGDPKLVP